MRADAFLVGRRTYEAFARDWPRATDLDDPVASRLNGLPNYVASRRLTSAGWAPSTILSGTCRGRWPSSRDTRAGSCGCTAARALAASLLAAGMVEELRLVIAPVVVGASRRQFTKSGVPAGLRLVRHEATPGGLAIHAYEAAGAPEYGSFGVS